MLTVCRKHFGGAHAGLLLTAASAVGKQIVCMLPGISFMDAGSMAVFSVACLALYKLASRFAKAVDESTMEVADYTVLVKGLPETTPIDVRG